MVDLSVNFAGLTLKNPLVVASGPTSRDLYTVKKAAESGASAVILKMSLFHVTPVKLRNHVLRKEMVMFSTADTRMAVKETQKLIKEAKREIDIPIIANIMGTGEDINSWAEMGRILEDSGADMLELNVSCPCIGFSDVQIGENTKTSGQAMGAYIGQSPTLCYEIVQSVKNTVNIPIMVKMTPEAGSMLEVARSCKEAGADAISAINNLATLPGVDIYNNGRPLYHGQRYQSFAALSGSWLRPLALRYVSQLRMNLKDIPIAGGGGLTDWKSTVEMIMVGATVTTYCTNIMLNGFETLDTILKKLTNYMREMGFSSISEFRGKALEYIKKDSEQDFEDIVAVVDKNKCNGCGRCLKIGHCEAIKLREDTAIVESEKCIGCCVCKFVCPSGAISLRKLKQIMSI